MTMTPFHRLQELARGASHDPGTALDQVLALACELLRMDTALLGTVNDGVHTVHRAVGPDGLRRHHLEVSARADDTFCGQVEGQAAELITDTTTHLDLDGPQQASGGRVRSYAGIHLGQASGSEGGHGVLELVRATPHDRLGPWEGEVLVGLAPVIAELWAASLAGGDADTRQVRADDVQGLTRPLLDALQEMSGLAATFLCRVDEQADTLEVLLVHRAGQSPDISEGAAYAWTGSMCELARAEGLSAVTDASARWPESSVGVSLGLVTHATVPVELSDGTLWGTLCASDVVVHEDVAEHVPTLRLFARLIAAEVERTAGLAAERRAAADARRRSVTDELTGAANRSTVQPWLAAAFGRVGPDDCVAVAFIDVDRFKDVNDAHGHAAGDAVLVELVARLRAGARSGDLVARLGGDELVVAAHLPREAVTAFEARVTAGCAFELTVAHDARVQVQCSIGYVTSQDATADNIVAVADARMYGHKARHTRVEAAEICLRDERSVYA